MPDYPTGNRGTLGRARTRVELLHDPCRFPELLDNDVALVLVDDPLELRVVVSELDREADGRASDRLVLGDRELDRLDTVGIGALAEELGMRRVVGQLLDALVDLADEGLVLGALLGMAVVHRQSPSLVVKRLVRRRSASDELAGVPASSKNVGGERRTA